MRQLLRTLPGTIALLVAAVALADNSVTADRERDAATHPTWLRTYGLRAYDGGTAAALALDGSIFVAADSEIVSSVDGNITSRWIGRLLKLDANGNILWSKRYPKLHINAVEVAGDGSIFLAGSRGWARGGRVGSNLFVARATADGTITWRFEHRADGSASAQGLALSAGKVFVVGTEHTSYHGWAPHTAPPAIVILRLSDSGEREAITRMKDPSVQLRGSGLAAGGDGAIYVAGTRGPLDDEFNFWSPDYGAVVARFTDDLEEQWTTVLDRKQTARVQVQAGDITVTQAGPLIVGSAGLTTDNNPWQSSHAQVLLAQFDPDGKLLWHRFEGALGYDAGRAVAGPSGVRLAVAGASWSAENDPLASFTAWEFTTEGALNASSELTSKQSSSNAVDVVADEEGYIVIGGVVRSSAARDNAQIALARYAWE